MHSHTHKRTRTRKFKMHFNKWRTLNFPLTCDMQQQPEHQLRFINDALFRTRHTIDIPGTHTRAHTSDTRTQSKWTSCSIHQVRPPSNRPPTNRPKPQLYAAPCMMRIGEETLCQRPSETFIFNICLVFCLLLMLH